MRNRTVLTLAAALAACAPTGMALPHRREPVPPTAPPARDEGAITKAEAKRQRRKARNLSTRRPPQGA